MITKKVVTGSLLTCFIPILTLGFFIYIPSLRGQFVWDDYAYILENPLIKNWAQIFNVFIKNIAAAPSVASVYYRPLQEFTNLLDYTFWGENVLGYHLTNVFLHVLTALCILKLTNLLYHDKGISFLTGLLFAVYPGHTEAVSYISGRCDPMASLFMLVSFICYLKTKEKGKNFFVLTWLSFGLALLSKENAVIFPVLLLFYHIAFGEKVCFKLFLPLLLLATGYACLKLAAPSFAMESGIFLQRIPGFFAALTEYAKLFFFPVGLHMDHGNPLFSWIAPRVLAGVGIFILLLFAAWRTRRMNKLVFFSTGWFLITLLPTSGIYPAGVFYMAEHWLYFPSIGFFTILAAGLVWLYRRNNFKVIAIALSAAIVFAYAFLTVRQNGYWSDPVTVYQRTLVFNPASYMAHTNLGAEYLKTEEYQKAEKEFLTALRIKPDYAPAYNNMCQILLAEGRNDEAVRVCQRTVELAPSMQTAYLFLGGAYERLGRRDEAVRAYEEAIKADPAFFPAYNKLARMHAEMGENGLAETLWKRSFKLDPSYPETSHNLAVFYFRQGRYDLAREYYGCFLRSGGQADPSFLQLLEQPRE